MCNADKINFCVLVPLQLYHIQVVFISPVAVIPQWPAFEKQ